jgi:hypothetical protein
MKSKLPSPGQFARNHLAGPSIISNFQPPIFHFGPIDNACSFSIPAF